MTTLSRPVGIAHASVGSTTADDIYQAIADHYKNNRREFDKTAKDWTKRYAGKK